jgi:polyphosphate kinase
LLNLKVHCKLTLAVRHESDGIHRYAHIATGNYNRITSQIYTDIGLFTADPLLVDDVTEVFNFLTGYSNKRSYNGLLVSPVGLRQGIKALIDREIEHAQRGRPARIIIKNNSVADQGTIKALYRASQAGVRVDMIVRGLCCLRPAIPGISNNIAVRSIVGRFLEHSRIYYFQNDGNEEVFIGSADLMERNLDRRVEVVAPIKDPTLKRHLRDTVLETLLGDTHRAWELQQNGTYVPVHPPEGAEPLNSQQFLLDWYQKNAVLQD